MPRRKSPPPFEVMSRAWQPKSETFQAPPRPPKPLKPNEPSPVRTTAPRSPRSSQSPRRSRSAGVSTTRSDLSRFWSRCRMRLIVAGSKLGVTARRWSQTLRTRLVTLRDRSPVNLRVPRGFLIAAVAVIVAIVGVTYWIGHDRGTRDETANASPVDRNLSAVTPGTPGTPGNFAGDGSNDADSSATGGRSNGGGATQQGGQNRGQRNQNAGVSPAPPQPNLQHGKADPRIADRHYYVLATYGNDQEQYVEPLLAFLWYNGVEVGAFNSHNSRFYQVVALKGFTRAEMARGDAEQYKQQLLDVGRRWKAVNSDNADFKDAYLVRHRDTKIKKSITKAN